MARCSSPEGYFTTAIQRSSFVATCPSNLLLITLNSVSVGNTTICASTSVAGGSNARVSTISGLTDLPSQGKISVLPNPCDGLCELNSSGFNVVKLKLINNLGQIIWNSKVMNFEKKVQIDLRDLHLPPGIYMLSATSNLDLEKSVKLIIQ